MIQVHVHTGEVAVIDAQQGVRGMGKADVWPDAHEILHGMDFQENGEAELVRQDHHVDDLAFTQAFGDEEDGIGTGNAAFVELPGIDEEVFAKDGEGDGGFDTLNEREMSTEKAFIGEAGDRPRASTFIPLGNVFRGKIITCVLGPDQACRGAHAFDLGNDGDIGNELAVGDGIKEVAGLWRGEGGSTDHVEGSGGFALCNLVVLVGDDVAQHGWQVFLEL